MFLGSTLARLLGSSTMLTGTLSGGDGDDDDDDDYGDVDDVYNLFWCLRSRLSKPNDLPVSVDERRQARFEKGLHVWGRFWLRIFLGR